MRHAMSKTLRTNSIEQLVRQCWSEGKGIDPSGNGYRRIHIGKGQRVRDEPRPYYASLAGIVRHLGFTRILEIGTRWGSATRAMWLGIENNDEARIATVDISKESDNRFDRFPKINKIVGDGDSEEMLGSEYEYFDPEPVALVPKDNAYQTTAGLKSLALYGIALRLKLIVLDNITLNDRISRAFNYVRQSLPESNSINAADGDRAIRPSPDNSGFGMSKLIHNI